MCILCIIYWQMFWNDYYLSKLFWIFESFKLFLKVKANLLMFPSSKIAYLLTYCLERYIDICVEDVILSITVRPRSTWRLGLEKILGYHPWYSKNNAIFNFCLLICNNIPSFKEFSILAYGHHKYILEIKESLLNKPYKRVVIKNISSAELFLFDNN